MWISAILGMCTKFAEVTLAVHFREKNADGESELHDRYLYGKDSDSILRADMNVTVRTSEAEELFERFYHALDQDDYTVAETVLDEMNSKLGDDPEIVKCRTQLDFSRM